MIKVFISYSHKDRDFLNEFHNHLAPLWQEGKAEFWNDNKIEPGAEWEPAIWEKFNSSDIIVLLVSSDFIASNFCYREEMTHAFERAATDGCKVVSVILRPCVWQATPLQNHKSLPLDGEAVVNWSTKDHGFTDAVKSIREMIEGMSGNGHRAGDGGRPAWKKIFKLSRQQNPNFTGRESLLTDLRAALSSQNSAAITTAVRGQAGVGKTELANEYAHKFGGTYNHVWWFSAEDVVMLATGFESIANDLDLPEKNSPDPSVKKSSVINWLEHNAAWLIVFDNVLKYEDIRGFLPKSGGHVIITSRSNVWGKIRKFTVEKWTRPESLEFLKKAIDRDINPECADELAEELGDLPLALEQAAAFMEQNPISMRGYLNGLRTTKNRKDLLDFHGAAQEYPDSVWGVYHMSMEKVRVQSPESADILNLIAFMSPDDIPKKIISAGAEFLPAPLREVVIDDVAFSKALGILIDYALIKVEPENGAISVHRLVQAVVREALDAATGKVWAEAAVNVVSKAFPFQTDDHRTWGVVSVLFAHAEKSAEHAEKMEVAYETTGRLLNQCGLYLLGRAEYKEAEPFLTRAIAATKKAYGDEHRNVAAAINNLAELYNSQGKYAEAEPLYKRAIEIDEKTLGPTHPNLARDINNLARLFDSQGKYAEAEPLFKRAITIFKKVLGADHPNLATAINNLAGLYKSQGKYAETEPLYKRAIGIDEKTLGLEHPQLATHLNNLAALYYSQGKYAEAEPLYKQALDIYVKALGENHPTTITISRNLVRLEFTIHFGDPDEFFATNPDPAKILESIQDDPEKLMVFHKFLSMMSGGEGK